MDDHLLLSQINNGIFSSNTYFYHLPDTGKCFVIDPGLDFEAIDAHLDEHKLVPAAVLCTHGHFDHLGSAQLLKNKYDCKIYLHSGDLKISKTANFLLMACKIDHRILTPLIDFLFLGDLYKTEIEGLPVQWLHVPGHTPGSCFVMIQDAVFTGDTIYKRAVGLNDFPGENKAQLIQSVLKVWDVIPEASIVYPGHGGSDSFGNIKKFNLPLRLLIGVDREDSKNLEEALDEK